MSRAVCEVTLEKQDSGIPGSGIPGRKASVPSYVVVWEKRWGQVKIREKHTVKNRFEDGGDGLVGRLAVC